ncbi:MAG: glycosyltransferase family 2 protein [Acidobacteriota bacterium]|nr:glycosyltransferase family 2 protein [Acidobacteriota bacterium]
MNSPLVYVIVLNFNGSRWLTACLESLRATEYANFKTLLVDNASTDDGVELVRKNFPEVELIINSANLGFSEGNNVGIRAALTAGANYVVLLNPDTKVTPRWLGELIAVGELEREVGVLGAVQLAYDSDEFNSWTTTALSSHLSFLSTKPHEGSAKKTSDRMNKIGSRFTGTDHPVNPEAKSCPSCFEFEEKKWIPVEWVEGACFAIKREVIETVGLLDPIYFAFYEEIDFCRRAASRGYQTALVPLSRIHHFRGGSWTANATIKRERDFRCDRSQFIFALTDPRRSLAANFGWYLITLGTKTKEIVREFSLTKAWDLLRIQIDLLGNLLGIFGKWRRERRLKPALKS